MSIAFVDARVLTMGGRVGPRKSGQLGDLGVLERASVLVDHSGIRLIDAGSSGRRKVLETGPDEIIEANGRVLMPGFVDCHTHACWSGERLTEWEQRLAGATYLDILQSGGGIMSTVRAVRNASRQQLAEELRSRLGLMLQSGTTTAEVKSGYGLSSDAELKMLRAIRDAAAALPSTVITTALLGHALDAERCADPSGTERFVVEMIESVETVRDEFGPTPVDAYCERGAWSVEQCQMLLARASALGCPIRVHADQFNSLGMTPAAVAMHARSVDHLEASTDEDLAVLAASETYGVALPVCGFHVDGRYARCNKFLLASPNAKLAIATNFNPGSAPTGDMSFAIALAVRHCGLTPAQAIAAATVNPAALLGFRDRGAIAAGLRADIILLRHKDERALAYEVAMPSVDMVLINGRRAWSRGLLSERE